jgi:uncharacterized protein Yka (UPF0111/DUF47 family)
MEVGDVTERHERHEGQKRHERQKRWFLPETPDVLGMLREQVATTVEGLDALVAWAGGDAAAADVVRAAEHAADDQKRTLWRALREAFTTPLDAEDLYHLSAGLDEVLNHAKDVVREAEVLGFEPAGPEIAAMATLAAEGVRHLADAFGALHTDADAATAAADAAVKSQRRIEKVYRRAMPALLELDDPRAAWVRGDVYRRLVDLSDGVIGVADRVWYAVVKEA